MAEGWVKKLLVKSDMQLLLIAVGCFALNYICWNILCVLTYVPSTGPLIVTIINNVVGAVWGLSFSAGLALFPVGLCLWKRSWRYPTKFFVLTGMSFIIAAFMMGTIPVNTAESISCDTLLRRVYWSLSVILFLQMVIQSAILGIVHLFTFRCDTTTPLPKWRWRLLLWFATFSVWVASLYFSARYLDKNFCC